MSMKDVSLLLAGAALTLSLVVVMFPKLVRADQHAADLPTWEYLEVVATVQTDHFVFSLGPSYQVSWTANGRAVNYKDGWQVLGSHGWQLVNGQMRFTQQTQYIATTQWIYWFKRPAGSTMAQDAEGNQPDAPKQ